MKLKTLLQLMEAEKEKDEKKPEKKEDEKPVEKQDNSQAVSSDTTADSLKPEKKEIPKKPKKVDDLRKVTADGIGRESYKLSDNFITLKLKPILKNEFNVSNVSSENNIIKITFKFSKEDTEEFKNLKTKKTLTQEEITNTIITEITGILNTDTINVDLIPAYAGGVLSILVKSKTEKVTDI